MRKERHKEEQRIDREKMSRKTQQTGGMYKTNREHREETVK